MLVSEYFDGEERSSVLGMSTGVTSLGGMVLMALGGLLGMSDWRKLYWVYGMGIIVFFIILICLPMDKVEENQKQFAKKQSSFVIMIREINPYTVIVYLAIFAMVLAINAYMINLSLVIYSQGIGDTAVTGLVNAIGSVGGIIAGFGFSFIRKWTKPNTLAFGFICESLALGLTYVSNNMFLLILVAILSGIGMVAVMESSPFLLSMLSKPQDIPIVMTIFAFINGLAGVLAPKIISGLGVLTGLPSLLFGSMLTLIVGIVLFTIKFGKKAESGALLQNNK